MLFRHTNTCGALLIAIISSTCNANVASKTYLSMRPVRPPFFSQNPLFYSRTRDGERQKYNFTLNVYGGKTFDSNRIASYFTPYGQCRLVAGELNSSVMQGGNELDYNRIVANYFGVQTANPLVVNYGAPSYDFNHNLTFQSNLSFCPRQTVVGLDIGGLSWFHKNWWFRIILPVQRIHNYMNVCEDFVNKGGGYVSTDANSYNNMTDAFANLKCGKICNPKPVWRLASVDLSLGKEIIRCDRALLGVYLGGSIATGNRVQGCFMFEPIVGFDHHSGFNIGSYCMFDWRKKNDTTVSLACDGALEYWATNKQTRLVDTKDTPWGRYLWTYPNQQVASVTGIDTATKNNPFALCMRVKQGFAGFCNMAVIANKNNKLLLEGGYRISICDAERVELVKNFNPQGTIATAGIPLGALDPEAEPPASNSLAAINYFKVYNHTTDAENYVPTTTKDLDLNSACTPVRLEHTFFGGLTFNAKHFSLQLGAAVGLASENAVARRWIVSTSLATSF